MRSLCLNLVLVAALSAGCGDDGGAVVDADPNAPDGSAQIDADPEAPDAAPGAPDAAPGADAPPPCNEIANQAQAIPKQMVAEDPPTPQGGTILDGTYHRTAYVIYTGPDGETGPTGNTFRETVEITGTTYENVLEAVEANAIIRQTQTMNVGGTSLTMTTTCGDLTVPVESYTVEGDSLILYGTEPAGPFAYTLVRQ